MTHEPVLLLCGDPSMMFFCCDRRISITISFVCICQGSSGMNMIRIYTPPSGAGSTWNHNSSLQSVLQVLLLIINKNTIYIRPHILATFFVCIFPLYQYATSSPIRKGDHTRSPVSPSVSAENHRGRCGG